MKTSPILMVGSMAFDDLELPSGSHKNVVGGSVTYSSFAASLFAPVQVVAVVGNDFPSAMLDRLRARGVDTSGIEHADGKTFRWAGRYSQDLNSRETLDTQLNVFADFAPKLPEAFRATELLLLGNIHPALQLDVLNQASGAKQVVADTMNFWIQGEPKLLSLVLQRVDTLVINDEEARELSGVHNIKRAAREILKRGPKRVLIKRGEHGALLFDELGIFAAPGYPLDDVQDPTGAGDSFAGGLMGYLARSDRSPLAFRQAMIHATAAASYCVEAVGTAKISDLTRDDIDQRVREICQLYDFGSASMVARTR
jgi:sugar/nucleoside kinase (ribokinase family)